MSPAKSSVAAALLVSVLATVPASAAGSPEPAPQGAASKLRPMTGGPSMLAPGNPPLTDVMVAEMAEALGRLSGSPFSRTELERLRQRAVAQWRKGVAYQESIRAAHARLKKDLDRVGAFPVAAQAAAWEERSRILRDEALAAPESFLNEAYQRATGLASDPLAYGKTVLTKSAGQAYFEMRDYFDDLAVNFVSQPTATETLRGGMDVAKAFAAWPEATRERVALADRVWAVARASIDRMTPEAQAALGATAAKVAARDGAKDAGGRLTPDAVWEILGSASLVTDSPAAYWAARLRR